MLEPLLGRLWGPDCRFDHPPTSVLDMTSTSSAALIDSVQILDAVAQSPGGILPSQWIRAAFQVGILQASQPLTEQQIQPNSLDLRLGPPGFRVQCSFLPGEEGLSRKLERFAWYDLVLDDEGVVLERNQVYLFPLVESLQLPKEISARANPKSSTGRLDIFTRLVTEFGTTFDEVPAGYCGKLYLEVVPRSFAVRLRPGDSLAQLRFQVGDPQLSDGEVAELLDREAIVLSAGLQALHARDLRIAEGVFLSVHLKGADGDVVGYKARKNTSPLDLRAKGTLPRHHYWERIETHTGLPIILEPDEFYIFSSKELVRLPPNVCAEMVPFDAGSGELRTHYAGFFDSGFGYSRNSSGSSADASGSSTEGAAAVVLEIRNRDVSFLIEDGHPLFRLLLLRNVAIPDLLYGDRLGSNYQGQRLKLGKQFAG